MEAAAAIAAFPPLIILIQKTAESMYRCAKLLSSARAGVLHVANEASISANLLMALHRTTVDAQSIAGFNPAHLDVTVCTKIAEQGNATVRMMKESLRKLKPLRSKSRSPQLKVIIARLRWLISAEDFTHIITSLNSVKTSAALFTGVFQLEVLLSNFRERIVNNQAIPEDFASQVMQYRNQIDALRSQISSLVKQCRDAENLSNELKSMNVELLKVMKRSHREHTEQNRLLRMALQSPKTFIDSREFETQLATEASSITSLASRPREQQPRLVPEPLAPVHPTTSRTQEVHIAPSPSASLSTVSTLSTSRTQTDSARSNNEQPRRARPVNSVPTALFQVPEGNTSSPSSSEYDSQPFVVDRNDENGTIVEYRRSRSSEPPHKRTPGQ